MNSINNSNVANTYSLNEFLAALFTKRDEEPQIKLALPKGEIESTFRKSFVYSDIHQLELSQDGLASKSLKESNESKNVLLRAENAVVLMLNNREQLEILNALDCQPSIKLQVGTRLFAVWLTNKGEDIQKAENALSQLFKTQNLLNSSGETWLPMPEFNLVELDANGNYSYTPIELVHLDASRRYTAAELVETATIKDKQKVQFSESAAFDAPRIESAVLENAQIESAVFPDVAVRSAVSKGERTYQNLVQIIRSEMSKSAILDSAFSELGIKARRVADLLKSAVSRKDIALIRHGIYAPKSAFSSDLGLPLAE